ncbi:PTH2 domain-containing protein [Cephalotus follicularis]|uniref:peptidyl-tRNA hydrolase n=1 Tax=Cephalotus follicularis TaxID=3775 RepID=A0A1Q3BPJ0_CEPFO|nr:PTH2 domain-containing protein [Cephalotus follicularis]
MATLPFSVCRFSLFPFATSSSSIKVTCRFKTRHLSQLSKSNSMMTRPSSDPEATTEQNPVVASQSDAVVVEDVLIQYVVLRRDLIDTWPLGSVVTQGCHASVCAVWSHRDDPHTIQYCSPQNIDSMHKVTLEVKGQAQILNLSEKLAAGEIAHKVWIEQPENIPTCLATKPYPKSLVSSFFKKLKLCK